MPRIMPRFQLPARLRGWINNTVIENHPDLRSFREEVTGSPGPLVEFMADGTVRKLSDEERVRKWGGTVGRVERTHDDVLEEMDRALGARGKSNMDNRLFNLDHSIGEFEASGVLTITHPGIDPHFEAVCNVDSMFLIAKQLELADDAYRIIVTPAETRLERLTGAAA